MGAEPARLVAFDRTVLEELVKGHLDQAQALMALLDRFDGDADLEPNGDDESAGDEQDTGWTEHHTRGRHKLASGMSEPFAEHEDDEDDDGDGDHTEDDPAFDEHSRAIANLLWGDGPGCPIADPGGCEHDGREHADGY